MTLFRPGQKYKKIQFLIVFVALIAITGIGTYVYADYYLWTVRPGSIQAVDWKDVAYSADGAKIYAVRSNDYIYHAMDPSGVNWEVLTNSGSRLWTSITTSSNGTYVAATVDGGYIWTSSDSGANWTERTTGLLQIGWVDITSSSDMHYLSAIAGGNNYIFTSSDYGINWAAGTLSREWTAVTSSSDGTKLAATDGGSGDPLIYTSSDHGLNWAASSSFSPGQTTAITYSSDGTKLAVAASGGYIYLSTNDGASWTPATSLGTGYWKSITSSSDGSRIAVLEDTGGTSSVYISADGGVTWSLEATAGGGAHDLWRSVSFSSSGSQLIAASSNNYLYTAVDETAPTITSVNSDKADGNYTVGEVIDIDITFSEPVTSTGSVTVTLETGETLRTCDFSVSSSNTATCDYTVQAGDGSSDLTVSSISGTISDTSGHSMMTFGPTTNLAANKALVIDTASPYVSLTAPVNASIATSTITLTASASDPNLIAGVQFKVDIDPETNIGSEDTSSPFTISWNSASVADGSHNISAVARDTAGNLATSSLTVIVDNTPPVISSVTSTSLTTSSATITWTTDTTADSLVEYGLSSTYTSSSTYSSTLTTSHTSTLTALTEGTLYHYRVISLDANGNRTNGTDNTFTTASTPVASGGSRGYTIPALIIDTSSGCRNNNLFNTLTGARCTTEVLGVVPGCVGTNLFSTLTGTRCTQTLPILPIIPTPPPITPAHLFTKDIPFGTDRSDDVRELQKFLNSHGFIVATVGAGSPGKETRYFGGATRAALKKFQIANGIRPAVGYFGPITRGVINGMR